MKRQAYATAQKQQLLDFLRQNPDEQFTVGQLTAALAATGEEHTPGRSTVYRHIAALCHEGTVRRFAREDRGGVVYQYVNPRPACEGEAHFHLKCVHCGRLVHLDCDHLARVRNHIQDEHSFRIGSARGILWGECALCLDKEAARAK